tara:strand:+ start:631 stop:1683 length:1053 start_codon:yes stop_codon:yes gene_type:complete
MLAALSPLASAETRGLVVPAPDTGEPVIEYKGSYALLIGASDYENSAWPDLESVPGELARVASVLQEHGFTVEKHLNPTGQELEYLYEDFLDRYGYDTPNRLVFFYSGHGWTSDKRKRGFLVPIDAPDPNKEKREFRAKALSMTRILAGARDAEANHALYLFDSCFSGTIFKTKAAAPLEPPHISKALGLPVRQFITAGNADEEVPARSTFTPAFVDALLLGHGDLDKDGYVSGTELGLYLQQEVPRHTQQTPQFGKINDYDLSRGDFIFALPKTQTAAAAIPKVDNAVLKAQEQMLDLEFWKTVRASNDPEMLQAYLETFPEGVYAKLAKLMLAKLKASSDKELTTDDI